MDQSNKGKTESPSQDLHTFILPKFHTLVEVLIGFLLALQVY